MFAIPSDPLVLTLYVLGWVAFSYVFVSFSEHQIHRHLMHKKRLPKWVYRASPYILDVFEAHAVRHHATWYKEFDYEPDPVGREENLDIKWTETFVILACLLPLLATMAWLFPLGCGIFLAVAILHNRLWNVLHRQMHIPQQTFFKNWGVYHFLARHHFMHHQQVGKNYNIVFPLADFVLGSVARPTISDRKEMLRLGYLAPRSEAARKLVHEWQADVSLRREDLHAAHVH